MEQVLWYPNLNSLLWIGFLPLSWAWAFVSRLHRAWYRWCTPPRLPAPTLSVGNLHVGGSGKTPIVVEIAKRFAEKKPVILTRGYRGKVRTPEPVDLQDPRGALYFGDEPWLLARETSVPVVVGKKRYAAGLAALKEFRCGLFLLDDGFSHAALKRDIDILLVNASQEPASRNSLPLGRLRESLSLFQLAQAVLVTGGDEQSEAGWRALIEEKAPGVPVFSARRKTLGIFHGAQEFIPKEGCRLGGFAGIADPRGFQGDLAAAGRVDFFHAFADHHRYRARDVDRLIEEGASRGAHLVTTSKDFVKVAPLFAARHAPLYELRIAYEIDDRFWYFLERLLEKTCASFC